MIQENFDMPLMADCRPRLVDPLLNYLTTMKITINKNGESRKMKHDWHLVDWDQPTSVIADQMGTSEGYVSGRRRKYAPETVRIHYTKKCAMVDRAKDLDWSKTDWQLAKETGRHRGSLWKTRQKLSRMNKTKTK
jgi:hypothetical protein